MYDLIINPHASRGKAAKKAKKVIEILNEKGVEFAAHYTAREKEAIEIAKELSEKGATDIIALGGDGTLNEVLNGINPEKVNLGLIPCGTGNDFARYGKSTRYYSERFAQIHRLYGLRRRSRHKRYRHGHRRGHFKALQARKVF